MARTITKKEIQERLAELVQIRERLVANLNVINGAIDENDRLLKMLEAPKLTQEDLQKLSGGTSESREGAGQERS